MIKCIIDKRQIFNSSWYAFQSVCPSVRLLAYGRQNKHVSFKLRKTLGTKHEQIRTKNGPNRSKGKPIAKHKVGASLFLKAKNCASCLLLVSCNNINFWLFCVNVEMLGIEDSATVEHNFLTCLALLCTEIFIKFFFKFVWLVRLFITFALKGV